MDEKKKADEVIGGILFDVRISEFSQDTEAAMKEAEAIAAGKIKVKTYLSSGADLLWSVLMNILHGKMKNSRVSLQQ